MKHLTLAALLLSTAPADACHHYSIWKNPWPQRCPGVHIIQAQRMKAPSVKEAPLLNAPSAEQEPPIELIMPLPSLDGEFPPDCDAEWCQRLKGIGLLRDKLGTN